MTIIYYFDNDEYEFDVDTSEFYATLKREEMLQVIRDQYNEDETAEIVRDYEVESIDSLSDEYLRDIIDEDRAFEYIFEDDIEEFFYEDAAQNRWENQMSWADIYEGWR